MKNFIKIVVSVIIAEAVNITGEINPIFRCLILLMIIDYMTGIIKAYHNKQINSQIGFFGIMKKVLMLLIVIVGQQIDLIFKEQGINLVLRDTIIIFYVINEIVSILENAGNFIPIPSEIKNVLEQLKKGGNK